MLAWACIDCPAHRHTQLWKDLSNDSADAALGVHLADTASGDARSARNAACLGPLPAYDVTSPQAVVSRR